MRTDSVTALALATLALSAGAVSAQEAPAGPAARPSAEAQTGEATHVQAENVSEAEAAAAAEASALAPDEQFELKVKGLEERVVDLKERIYRTKARLLLLQETVIGGDLSSGAKAVLFHRNEMGSSFVLESVAYALDGAPIFTRVDPSGELDSQEEFEVFSGRIAPGTHQIAVRLVYRGNGFGVFNYLNDYRFTVQSQHTFNAEGGKVTELKIVSFEKGGMTTDLTERPAIRYDAEVTKDKPRRAGAAQGGDSAVGGEAEGAQ